MRVEKTTKVTTEATLNGKKVTFSRELSDHELPDATIAFVNAITLIEQESSE